MPLHEGNDREDGLLSLRPLSELVVTASQIPAHAGIPNTTIQNRPLLVYSNAFARGTPASVIERHLDQIGEVVPQWRFTMYSFTHFHSTTHEVLCVVRGQALLCFGGEANPGRVTINASAGTVIVVPAGVGHCLLEDQGSGDASFLMIGSYPLGSNWDMCYGDGREGEAEKVRQIEHIPWFDQDPIYGKEGPVLDDWSPNTTRRTA